MDQNLENEKELTDRAYEMDSTLVDNVLSFIESQNKHGLIALLNEYHAADIADLFEQINPNSRSALIELWGKEMDTHTHTHTHTHTTHIHTSVSKTRAKERPSERAEPNQHTYTHTPRPYFAFRRATGENPNIKEDELHAASLQYNLNVKDSKKVIVKKGFIEVLDGATGFMLIKRNVFKKMAFSNSNVVTECNFCICVCSSSP